MKHRFIFESLARNKQYKYPYILLGFYITFLLSTVCMANKIMQAGSFQLPGGIFVFVFTFTICEIVGEVYGYAYPRLFIWIGAMAEIIFALVVTIVSHATSPDYFQHSEAYQRVFDPTIRYVISGLVGLLVGEFLNMYLLAKWKIFLRGKLFIIRSLVSAAIGQASLTIIVDVLNYTGKMSAENLIWMMISGYVWKIVFASILIFPSWLLVRYLKKVENVDYYDVNTNFNPFMLGLDNQVDTYLHVDSSILKQV